MHGVIDTNVIIYDTFEDSEFHSEAEDVLESLDTWYIPAIVLQEFVWFFKNNGFSAEETWEVLKGYLDDPRFRGLKDGPETVKMAFELLKSEKISLSRFNDAMILVHAIDKGVLVTFDSKFRKLARRTGVKVLP
ncbi:PIN domain-containing protein [Thermococcus aciditolerans]|uniref:Ribonuclease VapC n=1 Tax=Thermococcus aciditolerans TaxID=2598455 RepID=A0A5C0SJT1_9EURY|nr:PIN domain-containing protein [Thermococcus aciditolerans]QEK14272.1 PIN domain-containing protein [Thermococcus aciditolerans]